MLDLVQRGHGLLHGLGDFRLHGFGTCSGIGGDNDHIGEVHVGQQIRRHLEVCHHTQHHNGQNCHKNRQRFFYTESRNDAPPPFPVNTAPN